VKFGGKKLLIFFGILATFFLSYNGSDADDGVVVKSPLRHSITRASVLDRERTSTNVLLSTLEGYHQNPSGDQTQLISYDLESGSITVDFAYASAELRTAAYWNEGKRWIFAGGLEPSLYKYNSVSQTLNGVEVDFPWSGWIHGIGIYKDSLAVSSSGPSVRLGDKGIYQLDLSTNKVIFKRYPEYFDSDYSAVDTIDPSGRVWFYTAYPYNLGWLHSSGSMVRRYVPEHPDWEILSWDSWLGNKIVVRGENEELKMLNVDNFTSLEVIETWDKGVNFIPVDLFHRWQSHDSIRLYFNEKRNSFTVLNSKGAVIEAFAAPNVFGQLVIDRPREFGLLWRGLDGGEYVVLGITNKKLVVHRVGTKEYSWYNSSGDVVKTANIPAKNLTPASISSIAYNPLGEQILLTGALTHSEAVLWDIGKDRTADLGQLIPHLEGQIDWLKHSTYSDEFYGGAYPNAVIFRTKVGKTKGKSDVSIIWRADKTSKYRHFQRVISLDVSKNKGLVAAILKSDYSEKYETALLVHDGERNKTSVTNAFETGAKKLLSVFVDNDGDVWVLSENHEGNLVLISLEGKRALNLEQNTTGNEILIGEINEEVLYFNGNEIKKIIKNCTIMPCSKVVLGGFVPNKTFVLKSNQRLLILTESKLECLNGLELRTVKNLRLDARFLRYSQMAIGHDSLYFGYRDSLREIEFNARCQ
jgi:hypothetical protein